VGDRRNRGLRFQARQRYASKVTDLFLKSQRGRARARERVVKFNVEKIKPQDLAGAAGPPDEEI